jgi:hypothetical protein
MSPQLMSTSNLRCYFNFKFEVHSSDDCSSKSTQVKCLYFKTIPILQFSETSMHLKITFVGDSNVKIHASPTMTCIELSHFIAADCCAS